jgi:hypothetical protein
MGRRRSPYYVVPSGDCLSNSQYLQECPEAIFAVHMVMTLTFCRVLSTMYLLSFYFILFFIVRPPIYYLSQAHVSAYSPSLEARQADVIHDHGQLLLGALFSIRAARCRSARSAMRDTLVCSDACSTYKSSRGA